MKKILSVILILILCLSLAGCGKVPALKRFEGKSDEWAMKKLSECTKEELVAAWGESDKTFGDNVWRIKNDDRWLLAVKFRNDDVESVQVLDAEDVGDQIWIKMYSQLMGKPVIYLYPEQETEVTVEVDIGKEFTAVYPAYDNGWKMIASPDGTLTDPTTGREYYCLFWEGMADHGFDMSKGFCVKGTDTAAFLEDALGKLGLTDKEANEFIIYWLPQMEQNPYNLISFQKEAYTEQAKLTVTPTPDTVIRVFMVWEGLEQAVEIAPQELSAPKREGFTVVEWGAGEIGG